MTDSVPKAVEELKTLRSRVNKRETFEFDEQVGDAVELIDILIRLLEAAKPRDPA